MLPFDRRLHFSNQSPSALGRIREAGYMRGLGCHKRILGSYALVYLFEGKGVISGPSIRKRKLAAGDLIFLRPTFEHEYHPDKKTGWKEVWFDFDGPVFDAWDASGLLDRIFPVFHLEPVDFWLTRFLTVLQIGDAAGSTPYFVEIVRLQSLLADILVMAGGGPPDSRKIPWLDQACVLLRRPADAKLAIPAIAQKIGLSYSNFCRQFTIHVGMTPANYRMRWLINEAVEMMLNSNRLDKEIAFELGFRHVEYFYNRFHRVTGRTPSQFREEAAARKR